MADIFIPVSQKKSFIGKTLGLIGKKTITPIVFSTRIGIHTLFMYQAIDILLVDENKVVVDLHENLLPWRVYLWGVTQRFVYELPAGYIKQRSIRLGMRVADTDIFPNTV